MPYIPIKSETIPRTKIESCRGVVVTCDNKGAKIRLSRDGKFSGVINGKRIELSGPTDKEWEEFDIKT